MYIRWTAKTLITATVLVPFICGFLVWHKRKILAKIPLKPDPLGWILLGIGMLIQGLSTIGTWGYIRIFFAYCDSGYGAGVCWKRVVKAIGISNCIFGVYDTFARGSHRQFKFSIKNICGQLSTQLVNGLGVPAIREGSLIRTRHANLMVEDPCSGIRSLISLIALEGHSWPTLVIYPRSSARSYFYLLSPLR